MAETHARNFELLTTMNTLSDEQLVELEVLRDDLKKCNPRDKQARQVLEIIALVLDANSTIQSLRTKLDEADHNIIKACKDADDAEQARNKCIAQVESLRTQLAAAKERNVELESAIRYIHQRNGHLGDWVDDGKHLEWLDDKCSELLSHSTIASQSEKRQWQDISTAPKGLKVIVTYLNVLGKRRTVMARFYQENTLEVEDGGSGEFCAPGWYEESETHETILPIEEQPTHWMPLPEPPTSHSTKAEGENS